MRVWYGAQAAQAYSWLRGRRNRLPRLVWGGQQALHDTGGVPGKIWEVCSIYSLLMCCLPSNCPTLLPD